MPAQQFRVRTPPAKAPLPCRPSGGRSSARRASLDDKALIQPESRIDVLGYRHDIVVACQHHGCAARHQFGGVGNKPLHKNPTKPTNRSRDDRLRLSDELPGGVAFAVFEGVYEGFKLFISHANAPSGRAPAIHGMRNFA